MSDTPMKLIIDLSKPEGERETYVPLTPEEIAQKESDNAQAELERAEREAAEQARIEAKASAQAKLAALGLSETEISAIIG